MLPYLNNTIECNLSWDKDGRSWIFEQECLNDADGVRIQKGIQGRT